MARTRPGIIAMDVEGLDKVIENMKERAARAKNLKPAYQRIGPISQRNVSKHFREERSPTGKWKRKKKKAIKFENGEPSRLDRGYWKDGKFRPKRKTGVGLTGNLSRTTNFRATKRRLVVFNPQKYAGRFHGGFKGSQSISAHTQIRTRAFGRDLAFPVATRVKRHSITVDQSSREFLWLDRTTRTLLRELASGYIVTGRTVAPA